MQFRQGTFRVLLPDGRTNANILTESGCTQFLEQMGGAFIESNLSQDGPERLQFSTLSNGKKKKLIQRLVQFYNLIGCVADGAPPEVFHQKVPLSQLQCFTQHAKEVFLSLASTPEWVKTGVLQKHDQELLDNVIPLAKHRAFDNCMREDGLLGVLAEFCGALKDKKIPSPLVAESILMLCNNYQLCLSDDQELETIFSDLETCGFLGQAFRCFLAKLPHPDGVHAHVRVLSALQKCPTLVRKRLKTGKPTGDLLNEVLQPTNVSKLQPQVRTRLQILQRMAEISNKKKNQTEDNVMCRQCGKTQRKMGTKQLMMQCGRCKSTHYCSRDCQVKDWKAHKPTCKKEVGDAFDKNGKTTQSMVTTFMEGNYFRIMEAMHKQCLGSRVAKEKLIIEIDFFDDAPALRGDFKVGLTERFISGDRPDEPDWFYKGTDIYDSNVKGWLMGVRDHYSRLTDIQILYTCRYPNGSAGIYRMSLLSPETKQNIFSSDAMEAAGTLNVPSMERIFGPNATRSHMSQRSGGSQADEMLRALMALGFDANGASGGQQGVLDRLNSIRPLVDDDDEEESDVAEED